MSDAIESTSGDVPGQRRGGLRRRTSFLMGLVAGLVLGAIAAIGLPGLFPEGEPQCERPSAVTWQRQGGEVTLSVEYDGDGEDGCEASVVFSERPQS